MTRVTFKGWVPGPKIWQPLCKQKSFDLQLLLLSCAKSHMLSASRRQPHLLHVSAVDRRQIWSMDKSWLCVTLSGFLHSHIVRCRWNPIACGTHYSGPGLSQNDSAVTTDVCEDQNREVGLTYSDQHLYGDQSRREERVHHVLTLEIRLHGFTIIGTPELFMPFDLQ